jgi:hypothetical protein
LVKLIREKDQIEETKNTINTHTQQVVGSSNIIKVFNERNPIWTKQQRATDKEPCRTPNKSRTGRQAKYGRGDYFINTQ